MELLLCAAFFAIALFYGSLHGAVLADWAGFLTNGGMLSYGAQRVGEGQHIYRDFYFPFTPGSLYLYSWAQGFGGEKLVGLFASALTSTLVFHWGFTLGLKKFDRIVLGALLLLWGFSLWNIPHPSWLAVAYAVTAITLGSKSWWTMAGVFCALAFWFQQNVGVFAALGALVFLASTWKPKDGAKFLLGFLSGLVIPFFYFFSRDKELTLRAIQQISFFPLYDPTLSARGLPEALLGGPLVVLGLWCLSLYFFRASTKLRTLSFFAVFIYSCLSISREGRGFFLGCFFVFSLLPWVVGPILATREQPERRRLIFSLWLPSFGIYLLLIPDWGFPQFLIAFPLSAVFLLWLLSFVKAQYPWLPRWWLYAPVWALVAGGVVHQSRLVFIHAYSTVDSTGYLSYGEAQRANAEMGQVKDYLLAEGLKPNDPILVLPDAPAFYRFSGFKNPTPHDQITAKYVRAFGEDIANVLPEFTRAGGSYLVVLQGVPLAPEIKSILERDYSLRQRFPYRFTVWKKK